MRRPGRAARMDGSHCLWTSSLSDTRIRRLTHTELRTGLRVHSRRRLPGAGRSVSAHDSPSSALRASALPSTEGTSSLEPGPDPGNLPTASLHFKQKTYFLQPCGAGKASDPAGRRCTGSVLDWKCLLRRYTESALVGQAGVYLGYGFGGGHVPYGETTWRRGKKKGII